MNITQEELAKNIVLLTFDTQKEITSTFLRFQEHYESPEFRNKIFTLEEFKKWYSSVKGSFSYYTDWNGFNIPSSILDPFYEGKFDPLTDQEQQLLAIFREKKGDFYIIGVHKENEKRMQQTLLHEVAHGLFFTEPGYKSRVLVLLAQFDVEDFKNELRSLGGYCEEVLDDEVQAYAVEISPRLTTKIPTELITKIKAVFNDYYHPKKETLDKNQFSFVKKFFKKFSSLFKR